MILSWVYLVVLALDVGFGKLCEMVLLYFGFM